MTWLLLLALARAGAADLSTADRSAADLSAAEEYAAGIAALDAGDYPAAAARLTAALEQGGEDAAVYHALGNAFYRQGKRGEAIAAWRRGLALAPGSGDLAANLQRARRESPDRLEPPAPDHGPFFWQERLAPRQSAALASILATVALALGALAQLRRLRAARADAPLPPLPWLPAGALLTLAALLALSTAQASRASRAAVVIQPQAAARSALAADGVDLFLLHEGAEVQVVEERGDHVLVALSDGRKGWLPAASLRSAEPGDPFGH